MSIEHCAFCGEESTPWEHIQGHLCCECSYISSKKKGEANTSEEQDEWSSSQL